MAGLQLVTLVVRDYDEAINWYRRALEFDLIEDTSLPGGKRWVRMSTGPQGVDILLARASDERQAVRVGDQTGGRVGFFLVTDDFDADHARMTAAGVIFREAPRRELYGAVAVFEDLYGNLWDLIEPSQTP
ncbi:VOC family protein [Glycocaulis profundi]|nr:VOC family protein [Glycocaulis profundi]